MPLHLLILLISLILAPVSAFARGCGGPLTICAAATTTTTSPAIPTGVPSLVLSGPTTVPPPSNVPPGVYSDTVMNVPGGNVSIANGRAYGFGNTATALAISQNYPAGASTYAQVMSGFANPAGAGGPWSYGLRDSVGFFDIVNAPPPMIQISSGVRYDATHVYFATPLTSTQIAELRQNMLIDTNDSPHVATGVISSWAGNGSWIAVGGWQFVGTGSPAYVTPKGSQVIINSITKTYGANIVVGLNPSSQATKTAGIETDCGNNTGAYNPATDTPTIWCYDAFNGGAVANASAAYIARGNFQNSFVAQNGTNAGFLYQPATDNGTAFESYQTGGTAFLAGNYAPGGYGTAFSVQSGDGSIELGRQGQNSTDNERSMPVIDFHTQGFRNDFDARIQAQNGNSNAASTGTADLLVTANALWLFPPAGNVATISGGNGSLNLAVSAMDHVPTDTTGYLLIGTVKGTPTGAVGGAGGGAIAINRVTHKLCSNDGSGWHDALGNPGC
jgi:hypothetical protein